MHTVTGYNIGKQQRMGAQVHGLGANEPTCTPLATPLEIALKPVAIPEVFTGDRK